MTMRIFRCLEEGMEFDTFKSEACHLLKEGSVGFIETVLAYDMVGNLMKKNWHAKALYILALFDYMTDQLGGTYYEGYEEYRRLKLKEPLFPQGIAILNKISQEDEKERCILECQKDPVGKYFMKYNIVEKDIQNVV